MENRIIRLIKIADYLDKQGQTEDASYIDRIIKEDSDVENLDIEIPEDEYALLQEISEALSKSLT